MPETSNYQKHVNTNPIQKTLINNFYKSFFKMIKPLRSRTVLDVGCGEGITLKKLEEKKIGKNNEGIDYSSTAIKIGKKIYPQLKLSKGDIYKLDFKDNSFDLLICTEVLEHLKDPAKAVEEMKRVTSKYILISVPNEPFFIMANFLRGKYLKRLGNHPEHINHWTASGLEKFLKKQGLSIVKSRHPFAWSIVLAKKVS
jgi:ubiquinone/menaquinone biosynthesis C-methylase UbiE